MDERDARATLEAAGVFDRTAEPPRLLALGENAVFASGGLVAKVARHAEPRGRARRELAVAEWLAEAGFPAVRAARSEPRLVHGRPVTLWHRLPDAVRPAGPDDLAALLRRVHALPPPPFPLPPRDLLGGVDRRLRAAGDAIDPEDAAWLLQRRDRLRDAVDALTPHLPRGPIHGDALPRNVHVGPDGPVLVDLETFSTDLREHDLVVMALARDRYGLPDREYAGFARGYGWDVTEWEGYEVMRSAREIAACAWSARHATTDAGARAEFEHRVASLRDGDPTARWHAR
ncbi:phosphotransferase enzyme family protein [Streptomyces sp. WMMC905]|uniref:phosphotransferase enzyme family protein n=1 Tax=Streptomyces sp. WMMC905 TaxID=3404123 RepID=UPI003B92F052